MDNIYIIDAKRTAIGKFLGSLYEADPKEVCIQLIKNGFEEVEGVIVGNVISDGTVTAGKSSGINDGAAFVLLASKDYCVKHNIKPIAKIIANTVVGCDPQTMGLGPYYAISKLLGDYGITMEDVDYLEINEAFAAQVLGCMKLLAEQYNTSIDELVAKTNLHGSGLGLGHPLGATGARITNTLAHIIKREDLKYGVASLCIGGGMGATLLLGRVEDNEIA